MRSKPQDAFRPELRGGHRRECLESRAHGGAAGVSFAGSQSHGRTVSRTTSHKRVSFEEENARAAELVRRAAAGDRRAEAELVSMFDARLLIKLRRASKLADHVLDMRQEVWLRAIDSLRNGKIAHPERFCGFLHGVAQNVVLEQGKEARRSIVDLDVATALRHGGAPVEALLDRAFLSRQLNASMNSLNERDREVVYRHYIRQDDKEDTCRQLGLTSIHYSRVLHRARKRLAGLMEASLDRADLEPAVPPAGDSIAEGCERSDAASTCEED